MNNNQPKDDSKWYPDFIWHHVKSSSYQFLVDQGTERLKDVLSESESITNKSYKMISGLAAFLGSFIILASKGKWSLAAVIPFAIFVAVELILLLILVAPKKVRLRGIAPRFLIPKNFKDEDNKDHQDELLYYSAVVIVQDNIDYMIKKNERRAKLYKFALIVFLLLFVGIAALITSYFL